MDSLKRNSSTLSESSEEELPDKIIKLENAKAETPPKAGSNAKVVAAHYNSHTPKGHRTTSELIYMRNFNNWIKSMLQGEVFELLRENMGSKRLNVLDLCCGKGGDIMKWRSRTPHIRLVVFTDIAENSLKTCEERYVNIRQKSRNLYKAEFYLADATKDSLRSKYYDKSIKFDIVSCQFAIHYSFESLPQAEQMIKNVSDCLRKGGYFIGTTTDANEILKRLRASDTNCFSNRVCTIEAENFDPKETPPLFGAKFNFKLLTCVDCPEFLLHFPTLERIAQKYDLELVLHEKFEDFYERRKEDGKRLFMSTQCFEFYPDKHNVGSGDEYGHAKLFWLENKDAISKGRLGTLARADWEVITLYSVFAFQKK